MAAVDATLVTALGAAIVTQAASAGGDELETGEDVLLVVFNDSAAPVNVTIVTPGTVDGIALADTVLAVAAGGVAVLKLDPDPYRDVDGRAHVTWSATASVTFAVLKPAA